MTGPMKMFRLGRETMNVWLSYLVLTFFSGSRRTYVLSWATSFNTNPSFPLVIYSLSEMIIIVISILIVNTFQTLWTWQLVKLTKHQIIMPPTQKLYTVVVSHTFWYTCTCTCIHTESLPDIQSQLYPSGEKRPLKMSSNLNLSRWLLAPLLGTDPPFPVREKKKKVQ